ncbi:U39-like protein [Lissonota sp. PSUC_FEM 10030012]|nr:U39-like protein [Lissonota sp. PSUC_FEM 10030012]
MCKVDCRNCTFVCVHVCSTSSVRSTDIVMKQIHFEFRDDFKCNECGFVLEHRECRKFPSKKNMVVEYRCDRCRFFCNHTCFSEYNLHEIANGPVTMDNDDHWYMKLVCGNTMSRFKHTCGIKSMLWARKRARQRINNRRDSFDEREHQHQHGDRHSSRKSFESRRVRKVIEHNRRRTNSIVHTRESTKERMRLQRADRGRANCSYSVDSSPREKRNSRKHQRQTGQRNDVDSSKTSHHCCCSHKRAIPSPVSHAPRGSRAHCSGSQQNRRVCAHSQYSSNCDRNRCSSE